MDSPAASRSHSGNGPAPPAAEDERLELTDKLILAGPRDYTRLDLDELARITETPPDKVHRNFDDVDEWIDAFYCRIVDEYRLMAAQIPDLHEYTVGEKLSNFCLASMDMMRDHENLIRSTYHPFILERFTATRFEKEVELLFREFTEKDGRVALSNQLLLTGPVYMFWSREYLHMIGYWLENPGSEDQVMALMEKTTSLLNEILYNGVVDKAADLGKYIINNGLFSAFTPAKLARRIFRLPF